MRCVGITIWKGMPKLLLVEDTVVNRELLARRFAKWGDFEVICAENGLEGIRMAQAEAPGIILMDMGLPVMDGWTATKALKMDPATAGIPVIAVTAYAFRSDQVKCQEAGCNDFMAKPIDFKVLREKIHAWLAMDPDEIRRYARLAREQYGWDHLPATQSAAAEPAAPAPQSQPQLTHPTASMDRGTL